MSEKNVQLNEEIIKDQIRELVRDSVDETLANVVHSVFLTNLDMALF